MSSSSIWFVWCSEEACADNCEHFLHGPVNRVLSHVLHWLTLLAPVWTDLVEKKQIYRFFFFWRQFEAAHNIQCLGSNLGWVGLWAVWCCCGCPCSLQGSWLDQVTFKGPFQFKRFYDSMTWRKWSLKTCLMCVLSCEK